MAPTTLLDDDWNPRQRRRRPKRLPRWVGPVVLGAIVLGLVAMFVLRGPTISTRDQHNKIINVVLPPPPPPPPPPPKPEQPQPPKPTPIEQPKPQPQTPPPPTPQQQPAPGNDALTAREGPAAGNFGLAAGNGGGTRIGGTPGGGFDPFAAYANSIINEIARAAQHDKALGGGSWGAKVAVTVSPDGRIAEVHVLDGTGNSKRDAALQHLVGLQLSKTPPAGLPVMRLQLNARSGA